MKSPIPFPFTAVMTIASALLALVVVPARAASVNVTQHHNHDSRDGLYVDSAFTPTAAAGLTRDQTFSGTINGDVYAQPLYIEGGTNGKAMLIAVTEQNTVYALDAANGTILWQTTVGTPVPANSLPCGNISPFGITGTPIVDLPSRALFFDAIIMSGSPAAPKHFIFSMNVDTGTVNSGWPVDVGAKAKFGKVSFASLAQGQRGALAIVGSNVYVPFGELAGDCGTYYGWVVGVPMSDPTTAMAWATTARGGGLWSVNGVSSDGATPIIATGNTFSAATWGGGEAVIRLQQNLALTNGTADYWAPTNWSALDGSDTDVGSSGAILLDVPGATPSKLAAAFGKDGNVYLLNRTNLSGIHNAVAQAHVNGGTIIQAAATYQTAKGTYLVFSGASSKLYSLLIGATNPPTITSAWQANEGGRASPFVTSTDGTNNVIVWGYGSEGDQRLHGFNADTGSVIYGGGGANELMTGTHRFSTAIVARGRIFVAGDNKVYAFRVAAPTVSPITLTNLTIQTGGAFQFSFTNQPGESFRIFGTTNLSQSFTNWLLLGSAVETSAGKYQFTDPAGTSNQERFYRVTSP